MIQTSYKPGEWDFPALYESGAWEPETHEVLKAYLTPGSLFFDIGAWCGPVSLWALDLGASVIALEPDPVAREALRANTDGRAIRVLPRALSNHSGLGMLTPDHYFGDSASRLIRGGEGEQFHNRETLAVVCMTPRQLFQQARHWHNDNPSLIKVDIEGGEAEVLPLLGPFCARLCIPLLVSCHQDWWQSKLDPKWSDGLTLDKPFEGWNNVLCLPT